MLTTSDLCEHGAHTRQTIVSIVHTTWHGTTFADKGPIGRQAEKTDGDLFCHTPERENHTHFPNLGTACAIPQVPSSQLVAA